jgi:hypothetical protein
MVIAGVESSGTFYILWNKTGVRTDRDIANNQRSVHTLSKHALSRDCRHIERINVGVGVRVEMSDDISYLRLKARFMHNKL